MWEQTRMPEGKSPFFPAHCLSNIILCIKFYLFCPPPFSTEFGFFSPLNVLTITAQITILKVTIPKEGELEGKNCLNVSQASSTHTQQVTSERDPQTQAKIV